MDRMGGKRRLRFLLLAILRGVLHWRSSPLVLVPGTTVVVIAPHPDDEAFGCGLLLARPPAPDLNLHVVFLTRGESSHPGHPSLTTEDIARRRTEEAGRAAGLLGLPPPALHFLDLPDGRLGKIDAVAAGDRIAAMLDPLKPAVVLVPDSRDGSAEHAAASLMVERLAARPGSVWRRLAYIVWSAWSPRLLARIALGGGRVLRHRVEGGGDVKRRAVQAYGSQTRPVSPWERPVLPEGFVEALVRDEEFFLEYET